MKIGYRIFIQNVSILNIHKNKDKNKCLEKKWEVPKILGNNTKKWI